MEEAIEAVGTGQQTLIPVFRDADTDEPERIAEGFERHRERQVEMAGKPQHWTARRLVSRSMGHAQAAAAALRARVAKAQAQVEALNQRGRGYKRFVESDAVRQAVVAIVQRPQGEDVLWRRYEQRTPQQRLRASRRQTAGGQEDGQAFVDVRVDKAALASAIDRLGWRIYSTHQPLSQLSLAHAVLAYRQEYPVESSLGRLKGRPLSLTPMYGQRADHATGWMRLLSIALRVLTFLECGGRRHLAAHGNAALGGLQAGNHKRATARPTAERLREALQEVTLTVMEGAQQTYCHLTALSPLQERILELLGFSEQAYTKIGDVSHEPP